MLVWINGKTIFHRKKLAQNNALCILLVLLIEIRTSDCLQLPALLALLVGVAKLSLNIG